MNRGRSEAITAALGVIPKPLHPLVACDVLVGVDPVFAGLHHFETATDGRAYSSTAHVAYPFHQNHLAASRRRTTVVLPKRHRPATVVHELGHVLHHSVGFDHDAKPVTSYAQRNRMEAFAEAFCTWLLHGYGDYPAAATVAFFEAL
jgi:hypothetical protein